MGPVPAGVRGAFAYCISQVRTYDYANFMWCTQLAKDLRPHIFAIRAFNVETSLVGSQVKNKDSVFPQLRFAFWRDGLDAAYKGRAPEHPVLQALQHCLTEVKLSKYHFSSIVNARESDLHSIQPPVTVAGLEAYAEATASQTLYLQLQAAGILDSKPHHVASHVGKAAGIATLLQSTWYHAMDKRSYLPMDLCAKHRVSQEAIYKGEVTEGLKDVVLEVATVAKGHLDEARKMQSSVPPHARSLLLVSLAASAYLDKLEAADFNPFHPDLVNSRPNPLRQLLTVQYHLFRGSF